MIFCLTSDSFFMHSHVQKFLKMNVSGLLSRLPRGKTSKMSLARPAPDCLTRKGLKAQAVCFDLGANSVTGGLWAPTSEPAA